MIWIFGDSHSTAYKLDLSESWPYLLGAYYNEPVKNYAREAVDNFYIYQSILQNLDAIQKNDKVIIGWSHPTRKTFVYNHQNDKHKQLLKSSINYQSGQNIFFRSKFEENQDKNVFDFYNIKPKNKNIHFYDTWFDDYYSEYENTMQFQSYIDSIKSRLPSALMFYFSKESIKNLVIDNTDTDLYILDFIVNNEYFLSRTDLHLNMNGHKRWMEKIIDHLTINKNKKIIQNIL